MRTRMSETHDLLGGKLHVYKRDNSRFWQCSAFVNGRNHRVSTKEDSLGRAKDFAEDWFLELKGKVKRGEVSGGGVSGGGVTFAKAADELLREVDALLVDERSPRYASELRMRLKTHLLPFFGKRSVGYCKSMPGAVLPFKRLRDRLRPADAATTSGRTATTKTEGLVKPGLTDRLFPKPHNELLKTVLQEENLTHDRDGNPRTAYSLRHTYICLRLLEGADIYQIAKNCRTSVEIIEKYYASHLKNTLDASAINVRKPKFIKPTSKKDAAQDQPNVRRPLKSPLAGEP